MKTRFPVILIFLCLYLPSFEADMMVEMKARDSGFKGGTCLMCTLLIRHGKAKLEKHGNASKIVELVKQACVVLRLESPRICRKGIDVFGKQAAYVLSKISMTPEEVCFLAFPDQCSLTRVQSSSAKWTVKIPDYPTNFTVQPPPPLTRSKRVLKVLHITDVHIDKEYSPGSNAECGEPLCCRKERKEKEGYYTKMIGKWSGKAYSVISKFSPRHHKKNDTKAGQWGDYRQCDLPPWTFENLLETVAKGSVNDQYDNNDEVGPRKKIDYILWTGDATPHDIWNQNRTNTRGALEYMTNVLHRYFPQTRVFPTTGNHDSFPSNNYPPFGFDDDEEEELDSTRWVYDTLAEVWSPWLSDEALKTVRIGAYYTELVRPGFRIVSLNTNFCYSENLLMYLRPEDPAGMLKWFVDVLSAAEKSGEKVHVIGHVPPGRAPDCLANWSKNYYRILERFKNTITAQFFGHSHFDEIELFYGEENKSSPTAVAYVAPGVTPYVDMNPGFRVYDVDGFYSKSSWSVLNHRTYILNLDEVNRSNIPRWKLEYNALKAFGMRSLTPADWENLMMTWAKYFESGTAEEKPPATLLQYLNYYSKSRFNAHTSSANRATSHNTNLPCETLDCAKWVVCDIVKNKALNFCSN